MDIEEQRRRNREKVRRFRLRHPNYQKGRTKPTGHTPTPRGSYRTFELVDPRDPEQLPRLIGCGYVRSPWLNLWTVRSYSHSAWATWFQQLEAAGLEPEEYSSPYCIGLPEGVHLSMALAAAERRIRQVCQTVTGGEPPAWLLRHTIGPVAYVRNDEVCRYSSIDGAAEATHRVVATLTRDVLLARTDRQGRTWFDD